MIWLYDGRWSISFALCDVMQAAQMPGSVSAVATSNIHGADKLTDVRGRLYSSQRTDVLKKIRITE